MLVAKAFSFQWKCLRQIPNLPGYMRAAPGRESPFSLELWVEGKITVFKKHLHQ
jgi:hypothetical protein